MNESLTIHQPEPVAPPVPTVGEMLHAVIKGGVTGESVAAVKELVGLYRDMQKDDAAKGFAVAFVALQSEMPRVQATAIIPTTDGTVRSRFAPYEEIMRQVAPLLQKHGFTVTFTMDFREGRLIQTCTLQHIGGHEKSNSFAVRIGSGPPKSSETQADGAAATYAKRYALCSALNIVVDVDTDARAEGETISQEQAMELSRRVTETISDVQKFLKFAGAGSFARISRSKYPILSEYLTRKESGQCRSIQQNKAAQNG